MYGKTIFPGNQKSSHIYVPMYNMYIRRHGCTFLWGEKKNCNKYRNIKRNPVDPVAATPWRV